MNKALPEIHESAEALKERLRQEPQSRTQVGRFLGMSRRTVDGWLDRYEAEGLEGLLEIRTRPNRTYSLTQSQEARLKQKLSEPEGFPGYGAAQEWINETFSLALTYDTARQIVRYRLGAKLKGARKSHTKKQASA